jgi:hypothetical protein
VCVQADYMADDADDQTLDRFLEVYLLWLFGWSQRETPCRGV